MVTKLDWLPKWFYALLIIVGIIISFSQGFITDWESLFGYKLNWAEKVIRGEGDTVYRVRHLLEYVSGDAFALVFVIAAKRFLNDNKFGYHACAFALECLVIDIGFLVFTNPHEFSLSKWQYYGASFLVVLIKYLIDGRFNKYSLFNILKERSPSK